MNLFEDSPVKVSKKKRTDSSIVKEFLTWYYERYEVLFGVPPIIHWGKDNKLIAIILKTYTDLEIFGCSEKLEFLIKACEKHFISKDSFALKNAWNINAFYCNISKTVLLLKNKKDLVISPIIEGFKLAYFNYTGNKYDEALLVNKEEIFSQIYLFLKPLWLQHSEFSLSAFTEIFFLIMFDHVGKKEYNINFFYSQYAQDTFIQWLETEGKESLMFIPKEVGAIDKNRLKIEQDNLIQEELQLLENYK